MTLNSLFCFCRGSGPEYVPTYISDLLLLLLCLLRAAKIFRQPLSLTDWPGQWVSLFDQAFRRLGIGKRLGVAWGGLSPLRLIFYRPLPQVHKPKGGVALYTGLLFENVVGLRPPKIITHHTPMGKCPGFYFLDTYTYIKLIVLNVKKKIF